MIVLVLPRALFGKATRQAGMPPWNGAVKRKRVRKRKRDIPKSAAYACAGSNPALPAVFTPVPRMLRRTARREATLFFRQTRRLGDSTPT